MSLNSSSLQVMSLSFDAKTTGALTISTTENGTKNFYPLAAIFEVTAISGSVSVATVTIGQTSASYNDILGATALTGLTAVNKMINAGLLTLAAGASIPPNTDIKVNVTVGAVATSVTVKVMLLGYYN